MAMAPRCSAGCVPSWRTANRLPRDQYGTWTGPNLGVTARTESSSLSPTFTRQSAPDGLPPNPNFDHSKYDAIGESDRMTLKFVKPE